LYVATFENIEDSLKEKGSGLSIITVLTFKINKLSPWRINLHHSKLLSVNNKLGLEDELKKIKNLLFSLEYSSLLKPKLQLLYQKL